MNHCMVLTLMAKELNLEVKQIYRLPKYVLGKEETCIV